MAERVAAFLQAFDKAMKPIDRCVLPTVDLEAAIILDVSKTISEALDRMTNNPDTRRITITFDFLSR